MREFRDRNGVEWVVWEVIPQSAERRRRRERRFAARATSDRHERRGREVGPPRNTGDGWLTFESRHAKFRLSPIPLDWESGSDEALESLLAQAVPARAPRRLLE